MNNTALVIAKHLDSLPEAAQQEVLDFVEFLELKTRCGTGRTQDASWAAFSLDSAMRGMEDEPSPYTVTDIKESFR